jgi:hypothetical protein
MRRPGVGLEEQPGLGPEVLEDRSFRDAQLRGHRLDPRALVPGLCEVTYRALDDPFALRLGSNGPRGRLWF